MIDETVDKVIFMKLDQIQPSQLFISKKKLKSVLEKYPDLKQIDPIPIKKLNDEIIYTDGHTRAYAAYINGFKEIPIEWDEDELDWEMYSVCVEWCKSERIFTIADLEKKVISHEDYEKLWYERCKTMQDEIKEKRSNKK